MPRDGRSSSEDGMAEAERGAPPDEPILEDEPLSEDELMPRVRRSSSDDGMAEAERGPPPDEPMPSRPGDKLRVSSSAPEPSGICVAGASGANVVERRAADKDDPADLDDPAGLSCP